MNKFMFHCILRSMSYLSLCVILLMSLSLSSCKPLDAYTEVYRKIENSSEEAVHYKTASLNLSSENRQLKMTISELHYKIQELENKNEYLQLKISQQFENSQSSGRNVASIGSIIAAPSVLSKESYENTKKMSHYFKNKEDVVQFKTYKWTENQLFSMAKVEFSKKKYDAAVQYYVALLDNFPESKLINDEVLFQTGVSAYESGLYYPLAQDVLGMLVQNYPNSSFYRSAKLWNGLSFLKLGKSKQFYEVVEEFRKKYRNTDEWKILSQYYHNYSEKFKDEI